MEEEINAWGITELLMKIKNAQIDLPQPYILVRTLLVRSSGSLSSQQQLDCLNMWLSSTQDVNINGVPAKVLYTITHAPCRAVASAFLVVRPGSGCVQKRLGSKAVNNEHKMK